MEVAEALHEDLRGFMYYGGILSLPCTDWLMQDSTLCSSAATEAKSRLAAARHKTAFLSASQSKSLLGTTSHACCSGLGSRVREET